MTKRKSNTYQKGAFLQAFSSLTILTISPSILLSRSSWPLVSTTNIYLVEQTDKKQMLVELPARFRSAIWIKRSSYVVRKHIPKGSLPPSFLVPDDIDNFPFNFIVPLLLASI
jgi:hypothetical protein